MADKKHHLGHCLIFAFQLRKSVEAIEIVFVALEKEERCIYRICEKMKKISCTKKFDDGKLIAQQKSDLDAKRINRKIRSHQTNSIYPTEIIE
ncbi:hypothetical protein APICC_04237 [Apis cerana cerana]|uniref:Uncharacterized protein n=1 Tax=Apis cerana cerana TaxID=94128 RepID=A0A2A3E7H0_APICC|nr:hypothetical protein APICC_04237 [Apis cerana cerana]